MRCFGVGVFRGLDWGWGVGIFGGWGIWGCMGLGFGVGMGWWVGGFFCKDGLVAGTLMVVVVVSVIGVFGGMLMGGG